LVYGQYDIFDIADDNDEVKDDFIDELRKRIVPLIGNENLMHSMIIFIARIHVF
jgi:hypothetical protein